MSSNLFLAREVNQNEKCNINNMINEALSNNKNVLHINTPTRINWFKKLHPTTKLEFLKACDYNDIKIQIAG